MEATYRKERWIRFHYRLSRRNVPGRFLCLVRDFFFTNLSNSSKSIVPSRHGTWVIGDSNSIEISLTVLLTMASILPDLTKLVAVRNGYLYILTISLNSAFHPRICSDERPYRIENIRYTSRNLA